jgi:hypothetical protein
MQAFSCEAVLALTKVGMAMAANIPTTKINTNINPVAIRQPTPQ